MPNIYKQYKFLGCKSFLIIKDFNMIDEITMNGEENEYEKRKKDQSASSR